MTAAGALTTEDLAGDRYAIERLVATGGMAEVYLAWGRGPDGSLRPAALKRLKHQRARDAHAVAMFRDEARIGALCRHPNVVEVYEASDGSEPPFIAMAYVPGEELSQLCRRAMSGSGLPGPWEVAEIGRQAAAALCHVHELCDDEGPLDIVHGDVSPTNLLVTARGGVVLIDFGVARARIAAAPADRPAGKLAYMAPEQAAGQHLDHRADVFALGVILWELAAGARLFRGPADEVRQRLLAGDVPKPSTVAPSCPAALEAPIMAALARDPGDRPSARSLAEELRAAAEREGRAVGPDVLAAYVERIGVSERMAWPGRERRAEVRPHAVRHGSARTSRAAATADDAEQRTANAQAEVGEEGGLPPWLLVVAGAAAAAAAFLALWAVWRL